MDRMDAISLFVRVVDSGSFSAVARTWRQSVGGQKALLFPLLGWVTYSSPEVEAEPP
jgi:hypothetical protein